MTLSTTHKAGDTGHIAEHNEIARRLMALEDFGAKGDGLTDDSEALLAAVAYSKANGVEITASQKYLFTKPVVLDGVVSILGTAGRYRTQFIKAFDGDGFRIIANYCRLSNVSVICAEANRRTDTGSGIVLGNDQAKENVAAHYADIDVLSMYHGAHGLDGQKGDQGRVQGYFDNNKLDGVHLCSEWAGGAADFNANIVQVSCTGNGRHGLYLYRAEANQITAICQGNGAYGAYVDWVGNNGYIYAEGNLDGSVRFGASGFGNNLFVRSVGKAPEYDNNYNLVYSRGSEADYLKLFMLSISGAVHFTVWVGGEISAAGYKDFVTTNAYGAKAGCVVVLTPNQLLPQGITHEAICTEANTITVRVHNHTASPINLDALDLPWHGAAVTAL